MKVQILGIPIDAITRTEAQMKVERFLNERVTHLVVTPNPEMLVDASRDERFAEVLRNADLSVPDGAGLQVAARLTGQRFPERIPGADFTEDICAIAAEKGKKVFLLGGLNEDSVTKAADALRRRHADLAVVGAEHGGEITESDNRLSVRGAVIDRINESKADILIVGFGHRRQELWLHDNLPRLPGIQLGIGVGGTFDFISGAVHRAPASLRRVGLEWLWRLIMQPWRWRRIWKAVAVFPMLVIRGKHDKINR